MATIEEIKAKSKNIENLVAVKNGDMEGTIIGGIAIFRTNVDGLMYCFRSGNLQVYGDDLVIGDTVYLIKNGVEVALLHLNILGGCFGGR